MEWIEMKSYDQEPEYNDNYEETDFGGGDQEDLLGTEKENGDEYKSIFDLGAEALKVKLYERRLRKKVSVILTEARIIRFFRDTLKLESECFDRRFLRYLREEKGFELDNNEVTYKKPGSDTLVFMDIYELYDYRKVVDDIRSHYYNYKNEILRRRIKRAGIVGGVVIALAAVVTGLALGLKRKGKDMQRNAVPLRPSKPVEPKVVPWTPLEETTGKAMVWTAENIVALIVVGLIILRSRT